MNENLFGFEFFELVLQSGPQTNVGPFALQPGQPYRHPLQFLPTNHKKIPIDSRTDFGIARCHMICTHCQCFSPNC